MKCLPIRGLETTTLMKMKRYMHQQRIQIFEIYYENGEYVAETIREPQTVVKHLVGSQCRIW